MGFRIVATTDVHGNLFSRSFADGSEVPYGAPRLSSYLEHLRSEHQVLLVDNGDTNQGTPLVTFTNAEDGPLVMNQLWQTLQVDYANIGNHDFNFGPALLQRFVAGLGDKSICSNVTINSVPIGAPKIFDFAGLRMLLVGVVTDYIPHWEAPANLVGVEVGDVVACVKEAVAEHGQDVDCIVVAYHGGLEADPLSGQPTEPLTGENVGYRLCQEVPEIDLLISGHQHRSFVTRVGKTVVTQCRDKASECVEITVDPHAPGGVFSARVVDLSAYPIDADLEARFETQWLACNEWLDTPIGQAEWDDMYITDFVQAQRDKHPFTTFVNDVQRELTNADLAACCMFESMPGWGKTLTYRDVYLNYPFPNTLVVKKLTGKQVLEYLHQLAQYWTLDEDGNIVVASKFLRPKRELYNYDFVDGLEYTIVVSPQGSCVTRVLFEGKPFDPERDYTIAINNYRAAGGGGFSMFPQAPTVYEDTRDMAEILIGALQTRVASGRTLTVNPVSNIHLEVGAQ